MKNYLKELDIIINSAKNNKYFYKSFIKNNTDNNKNIIKEMESLKEKLLRHNIKMEYFIQGSLVVCSFLNFNYEINKEYSLQKEINKKMIKNNKRECKEKTEKNIRKSEIIGSVVDTKEIEDSIFYQLGFEMGFQDEQTRELLKENYLNLDENINALDRVFIKEAFLEGYNVGVKKHNKRKNKVRIK